MNTEISRLIVIGISHKTSAIAEREKYQITKNEIKHALNYFNSAGKVEGAVIVSTCCRQEFYLVIKPDADPFLIISDFYYKYKGIEPSINKELFYLLNGIETVEHLFNVAAGLDSILRGDNQALGQIKAAYAAACSEKSPDKILHKLFHNSFRVSKAARIKTGTQLYSQTLAGVAFNIIKDRLKKEDVITIIGVNRNTRIIAEKLNKAGFTHLLFVNRILYEAEELAEKYKGVAFSMDYIEEPLISSKCLVSCIDTPGNIINAGLINEIYLKNQLPKLIIDMALPRNINTEGLTNDIEVINLEGLKKFSESEKAGTAADISEAEKIISGEAQIFCQKYGFPETWEESQTDDGLSFFQEKIESIRLQLLDEIRMDISDDEINFLDRFSHSLIHRMKSVITQVCRQMPKADVFSKGGH